MAVHTTLLFSGSCEAGKAAARSLHVKLLGNVGSMFPVHVFGRVHMEAVLHPYLVSSCGWLGCVFGLLLHTRPATRRLVHGWP